MVKTWDLYPVKNMKWLQSDVVNNPKSLHKTEKEDGDDVYYKEDTNEFVVVSTDGYIRTYFNPDSGKKYFDRQIKKDRISDL